MGTDTVNSPNYQIANYITGKKGTIKNCLVIQIRTYRSQIHIIDHFMSANYGL